MAFCLSFCGLRAQISDDSLHYSLKRVLSLARENSKDLKLLQLDINKTYQDAGVKKSGYLPKINAFADYYYYMGNVPQYIFPAKEGNILSGGSSTGPYPVSIGLPNNMLAGVSLSQRLFEFSFLTAGKSGELLGNLEANRIREKREQLYYDIALCYYEILQLESKKEFINFNVSRVERFIEIVQVQLKNKMTDSLQLVEVRLAKTELELKKSELESGIQRKTNYLKMLAGLPQETVMEIELSGLNITPDSIRNQKQPGASPQLDLITNAQSMNELTQKQVQSEYLPTLDLKLNLLWMGQSQNLDFSSNTLYGNNVSTIGMKLDIPIYQGSEKKHKIQKLEIDRQMLELQKQKLVEGYQLQAANFFEDLKLKTARYHYQQDITQLKKKTFGKESKKFEEGILPVKELLNVQSALLESQMKETEALFDMKIAELNYYKWSNQILSRLDN
jgi:outer membrane protein